MYFCLHLVAGLINIVFLLPILSFDDYLPSWKLKTDVYNERITLFNKLFFQRKELVPALTLYNLFDLNFPECRWVRLYCVLVFNIVLLRDYNNKINK